MSITKALLIQPRPCPFCNSKYLELRAAVFRQWCICCLNRSCLCRGPYGEIPDIAVAKWNSLAETCLNERKNTSQLLEEFQNPNTTKKLWKAIRSLRKITLKDLVIYTECNRQVAQKYLHLLIKNEYLRPIGEIKSPISSNEYRCVKPEIVRAPGWITLQLTPNEYEIYKRQRKSLKWNKLQAAVN